MNERRMRVLDRIEEARNECLRFLRLEPAATGHFNNDEDAWMHSPAFARLKRQSLELSRALVELRKGTGE